MGLIRSRTSHTSPSLPLALPRPHRCSPHSGPPPISQNENASALSPLTPFGVPWQTPHRRRWIATASLSERIIMICAGDEGGLGVVHVVGADAVRRPTTCWVGGGDGEQSQVSCRAERRFGERYDDGAATGRGWGLAGGPYHVGGKEAWRWSPAPSFTHLGHNEKHECIQHAKAQNTQRRTGKFGIYVARTHHEDLRCRACVAGSGEAHLGLPVCPWGRFAKRNRVAKPISQIAN